MAATANYNVPPKTFTTPQQQQQQPSPHDLPHVTLDIDNSTNDLYGKPGVNHQALPILINARIRGGKTPGQTIVPDSWNRFGASNPNQRNNNATISARPPLHVTVCQDISGSLAGTKLAMCQRALNFVVDQLAPTDRFGLVTFGHRVREIVPLTEMTAGATGGKEGAKRSIYEMEAGGNTSLEGGLITALRQEPFVPGSFNNNNNNNNKNNVGANNQASLPLVLSHTMTKKDQRNAQGILETIFSYTLIVKPPASCTQYVISCPDSAYSKNTYNNNRPPLLFVGQEDSITASGEAEFELPPVREPINKLVISFFFEHNSSSPAAAATTTSKFTMFNTNNTPNNNDTFRVVEYQLGESPMKKQHVDLSKIEAQIVGAKDNNNNNGDSSSSIAFSNAKITRVILLFTDGNVNSGQIAGLKAQVTQTVRNIERAKGYSPLIYTFGFGNETNSSFLLDIAGITHSSFYHITQADHIPRVFADVLGSLFSVVARNLRLRIVANASHNVTISKVYSGNFTQTVLAQKPATTHFASNRPETEASRTEILVEIPNLLEDEFKDILVEAVVNVNQAPITVSSVSNNNNNNNNNNSSRVFAPVEFFLTYESAASDFASPMAMGIPAAYTSTITYHSLPRIDNQSKSNQTPAEIERSRFVDSIAHRFRTQEALEKVRQLADSGAMREAKERAIAICQVLEVTLADIREQDRNRINGNPSSSSTSTTGSNVRIKESENTLQLCLSQANHVASTSIASDAEWNRNGGQQIVNSYVSELGIQRNNNTYGVGGSGDVGERARSVFEINETRKKMRALAQNNYV